MQEFQLNSHFSSIFFATEKIVDYNSNSTFYEDLKNRLNVWSCRILLTNNYDQMPKYVYV